MERNVLGEAEIAKLPKAQRNALAYLRRHLDEQLNMNPEYGDEWVRYEVEMTGYGSVWVIAEQQMTKLPDGNVLRAVSREFWMVLVGKRGALTLKMGPQSYKQFNGRKAFGINVDLS